MAVAPEAELISRGTPAAVRREGGSTERIATTEREPEAVGAAETARTDSATASSSRDGSKRMLGPVVVTRRVMGGFCVAVEGLEGRG